MHWNLYASLARIEAKLDRLTEKFAMSTSATDQNFANLQAEVEQTEGVEQSAVSLLTGLSAQLNAALQAANQGDSQALPALQTSLAAATNALAAAIAANPLPAPPITTGTSTSTGTGT